MIDLPDDCASARDIPVMQLTSGAGHDAMHIARLCPAGMILVPSRGGISHHRDDWTDLQDVVAGAQVFVDAAIELALHRVPAA